MFGALNHELLESRVVGKKIDNIKFWASYSQPHGKFLN